MEVIILASIILISNVIGFIFGYYARKKSVKDDIDRTIDSLVSGNLRLETSDPDGPYMFLELTEPAIKLLNEDIAVLRVVKDELLSQK